MPRESEAKTLGVSVSVSYVSAAGCLCGEGQCQPVSVYTKISRRVTHSVVDVSVYQFSQCAA